ncbi:MAG: sodium/glutamate symporter [Pigmentiphaga sp.]|nr:sodium/glutamate symporter [Pigmentiphaga sp.]
MDQVFVVDALMSTTLAILLLFVGRLLAERYAWLHRYSIPEPVVGGALCALVVFLLYEVFAWRIVFELWLRDVLLLYFFAAIGLSASLGSLKQGGKPLVMLVVGAAVFMVLQNLTGMGLATLFGLDPRTGLMVGSVSLVGGVGTTAAWAQHFENALGILSANEIGQAANMVGIVAACVVGGPIASYLIRRHGVRPSGAADVGVGALNVEQKRKRIGYYGILFALLWLNVTLLLGEFIGNALARTGLNLPAFVGCLLAGILLRALGDYVFTARRTIWNWEGMQPGVALISDICLGVFLTMALMGMRLWELESVWVFVGTVLLVQIALTILYAMKVIFPLMGRDYDAVVVSAGFGGIALGSTATAMANMTAVAQQFGAAPRAFIVVPLVCGFFIDLLNALLIGLLAQ